MNTENSTSQLPADHFIISKVWKVGSVALAVALILLGLAWELVLDPLRPGGSWLALKVLPLVLALGGLWKGRPYTFKWMSLMVWFYVGEALVRIVGLTEIERMLAWNYLALSCGLTVTIFMGARQYQQHRIKQFPADQLD
jgi:uncharacterized membrane protein